MVGAMFFSLNHLSKTSIDRRCKNEKNTPLSTAYNVFVRNIESKCLCSRK